MTTDLDEMIEVFEVPQPSFVWAPRYNIAPTQIVPVVAQDQRGRRMGLMRWGLVPYWAKDLRVGNRHINARAETLPNRSAFKASFANRRCLVPATGFYEWSTVDGRKRPHWIHAADHGTLGFAGLWDRWRPAEGDPVYSFTIVTVPAGPDVTDVHHRMPAILDRAAWSVWLDRERAPAEAQALLRPLPGGHLDTREVSTWVNTPTNDDETCLEPAD